MSDRPTSFHDFNWACGHTGPGHCKICRDSEADKIEALEAENKRLKLALQNNLHEALYQKQVKALQAKVEQLEAKVEAAFNAGHETEASEWSGLHLRYESFDAWLAALGGDDE